MIIFIGLLGKSLGENKKKNDISDSKGTNRKRKLDGDNYIIVHYKETASYSDGFKGSVSSRNGVIKEIEYNGNSYGPNEQITINEDNSIKISFSLSIATLESFFNSNGDWNAGKIISIDFSHFDSSEVTSMASIFRGCTQLEYINFSGWNTKKLEDLSNMFYQCSQLKSVDLSNFDTTLVTSLGFMFTGCSQLQSVDLSNFDTSLVTDMSYMFTGCSQLQSIDLSNFNTSLVTDMSYMFSVCSKLQSIDLSNFNTPLLQQCDSMFYGCSQLQSIILSNFKSSKITSMNEMFEGCISLKFLDISSCDSDMTSSISSMFNEVTSLEYLNIYNLETSSKLAEAIKSAFNTINNLAVCQKNDDIITNANAIYACGFQNYITVKYKESVQYINGFQISPRSNILFI